MVKRLFPTLKRLWSSDTGLTALTILVFLHVFVISLDAFLVFLFTGLLSAIILIQVFREGPITVPRIMGAVTVYLLIGQLLYESAQE